MTTRLPSPPRLPRSTPHSIIVGGEHCALAGERPPIVLTWLDHGISFRPGEGHNRPRRRKIDLAVWHWTGGEGEPPQVAATLKMRGYGVEFAIARTGVVWQFADPLEVDTADAAGVNARSVGIEIVSYGMRDRGADWKMPLLGHNRLTQQVLIHGRPVTVAAFYPAQILAARALADALSNALDIPRRVPLSADGVVLARAMNVIDLARFTGHVGHYHLSSGKCDPGPEFMAELNRSFSPEPPLPLEVA